MSRPGSPATAGWLTLREPADAAARSTALVAELSRRLPARRATVVHDLGCGTGSMCRWLAPRLRGPQHWVGHDRDAQLLSEAASAPPPAAADGAPVTVETHRCELADLTPDDLAGASLITASALLDVLTAEDIDRVAAAWAPIGCPVLLTLSVVGRIALSPPDPWDAELTAAFNAHQRRATPSGSRLLGPDAVGAAAAAFGLRGAEVLAAASPWRLDPNHVALVTEWLRGWIAAAVEQQPGLARHAGRYLPRRMGEAAQGRLEVTVHHCDLLVLPGRSPAR